MFRANLAKLMVAAAAGAALAYLFDVDRGRARRARLRDQTRAAVRRDARAVRRRVHYDRGRLEGLVHRATSHPHEPASDHVLVDKVRSEVFGRMPEVAHHVSVDAAKGTVTLRGQLDSLDDIARLEAAVRQVDGVGPVLNLLHLPGEAAPNKADALGAH